MLRFDILLTSAGSLPSLKRIGSLRLGPSKFCPTGYGGRLPILNIARVTDAIRGASEFGRDLGAVLSEHADSLASTAILKTLEALRERVGEEAI